MYIMKKIALSVRAVEYTDGTSAEGKIPQWGHLLAVGGNL